MASKTDIRQFRSRDSLPRITGAADSQLDLIIRALEKEVTPPLALSASSTPNLVLNIGNIAVVNPSTSLAHTIPPISNLLPTFASGTVTMGSTGAGNATPSTGSALALAMTSSQYLRIGISLDAAGTLTLTKGTAASSLAAATIPPTVSGLFAIGHVVVRTDGSNNVQNILASDIYQYAGGGGGSGSGSGNPILESIKNQLFDSPYELVTPNIVATDSDDKFATLTGAALDLVTNTIKFTADSQVSTSIQMLDEENFLDRGLDVGSVDLTTYWNPGTTLQALSIPTAFTYEVSRDGGTNWFTMTMERLGLTEVFRGNFRFDTPTTTEATKQTLASQVTNDASRALNATTEQAHAQQITVTSTQKLQEIALNVTKTGSPTGNLYVAIIRDSAGTPSTAIADLICQSAPIAMSGISTGVLTVDLPDVVVTAGDYHIVLTTDATYKSGFSAGVTQLAISERQTGEAVPYVDVYNGTAWATSGTTGNLVYTLKGRALDLRIRITSAGSPTYPVGLDGYGVFYNIQDVGVFGGVRKNQRFTFNSVTDNLSSFAITAFNPDPDLLTCYWIEGGQSFKVPAFELQGGTVVFPVNTFNNGGVSATMTLLFDQNNGETYDNADVNARLLAANHLGSTSGSDDRSVAGRGFFLRRPDGTLREIILNDDDEFEIYSV